MSVDDSAAARVALRAAWDEMLTDLARARDAIDQPERMPAPPSDRNLAEGYRYLMGYSAIHAAIECVPTNSNKSPKIIPCFRN